MLCFVQGAESTQHRAPSQKAPSMMEPDRKSQYSQRYERPASPYNPQPYIQPDYAAGPSDRSHASRESSAPDITVVPPPVREFTYTTSACIDDILDFRKPLEPASESSAVVPNVRPRGRNARWLRGRWLRGVTPVAPVVDTDRTSRRCDVFENERQYSYYRTSP